MSTLLLKAHNLSGLCEACSEHLVKEGRGVLGVTALLVERGAGELEEVPGQQKQRASPFCGRPSGRPVPAAGWSWSRRAWIAPP